MNIQHILLGIIVAVLLVASSYGAPLNESETNVTIDSNFTNFTNPVTTLITTISTQTTAPFTTARVTTEQEITSTAPAIVSTGTSPIPSVTTAATATSSTASTSTKTIPSTTKASGRKFDGLSFVGGIILASGLGGIIFLVVSYLRRSNRLPYSNLR